ncbi:hypothetical protein Aca07nite_73390 [Actinoplanes capillaceus]|uniref:Uncharacterized protein n=1 Tax=Actinoplanes campanulatus TaxID=113559 RepID=A0ABQ3WUY1_9ACTN|nr:hypothetical protein Aca07nite_73390 [Actinoplanes capillaceus]
MRNVAVMTYLLGSANGHPAERGYDKAPPGMGVPGGAALVKGRYPRLSGYPLECRAKYG